MRTVQLTLHTALFVLANLYVYLLVDGVSIVMVLPDISHISLYDFFERNVHLLKSDLYLGAED